MKINKYLILIACLLLNVNLNAADANYLGGRSKLTTIHPTTNHIVFVMGDGTNAPYRNSSLSNALHNMMGYSNWPLYLSNNQATSVAFLGDLTVTDAVNTDDLNVTGTPTVKSMKFNIWTNYVNTVSNFVFTFNTNRYELKNQTNVIFTNIVEEATAVGADMAIHIHNTTGVTMGLVWPAYGAQHGYFFQTNINNPILTSTTLTTGKHGVASFTAYGTNIFATWVEWP